MTKTGWKKMASEDKPDEAAADDGMADGLKPCWNKSNRRRRARRRGVLRRNTQAISSGMMAP